MSGKKVKAGRVISIQAKRNEREFARQISELVAQRIERNRIRGALWRVARWGVALVAVIAGLIWIVS